MADQGGASAAADGGDPGVPLRPGALLALVVGQLGVHATMAGLRLAAPLQALREGYSAWAVGLLLAMFAAAPVLLAMHAGRLADRHGYHRPVHVAIVLSAAGALLAVASTLASGVLHFLLLCTAATAVGAGANMGMLAIQRTAGLAARNPADRVRIFSWLGLAPSLANVVGPVSVGFMIDAAGFRSAYLMLVLLPLLSLASSRRVPPTKPLPTLADGEGRAAWELLRLPGMKRLLFINWLLATAWDVHAFAVPIVGHEHGFSASTIGLVLGTFTLSVSAVRMIVPLLAHRVEETAVVRGAMLMTGVVLVLYPFAATAWLMASLAVLLGIALGAVQPMIMSTLHHLTPAGRHGESLAFRSMAINLSSSVMPLAFGAAGVVVGAAALFWVVGAAVGAGSNAARGLTAVRT